MTEIKIIKDTMVGGHPVDKGLTLKIGAIIPGSKGVVLTNTSARSLISCKKAKEIKAPIITDHDHNGVNSSPIVHNVNDDELILVLKENIPDIENMLEAGKFSIFQAEKLMDLEYNTGNSRGPRTTLLESLELYIEQVKEVEFLAILDATNYVGINSNGAVITKIKSSNLNEEQLKELRVYEDKNKNRDEILKVIDELLA